MFTHNESFIRWRYGKNLMLLAANDVQHRPIYCRLVGLACIKRHLFCLWSNIYQKQYEYFVDYLSWKHRIKLLYLNITSLWFFVHIRCTSNAGWLIGAFMGSGLVRWLRDRISPTVSSNRESTYFYSLSRCSILSQRIENVWWLSK